MRTSDYESIFEMINNTLGKPGKSNCVLPFAVIKNGLEEQKIDVISRNPLILVENKKEYSQLYYFLDEKAAITEANLHQILYELKKYNPLYADLVTRDEFEYEKSFFKRIHMVPYRTYLRKNVMNQHKKYRELMETEYADQKDLEETYEMLQTTFDFMSDHIPDKPELEFLIKNHNVLKISVQGKIAGTLLFEDAGVKSYARALCVDPDFRGGAVGFSLLAKYFNQHDNDKIKLFYLWVHDENESVRKLHDRFGYQKDGLKDYIFRKESY